MTKKSLITGLFFCIVAVYSAGAATVSFLVIETSLPEAKTANQYTVFWEDSLMEVFFEAGHIVTNSPIIRLNAKPAVVLPQEAERDLALAQGGGMEYFLVTIVEYEYPASARKTETLRPSNVSMRLFNTGSRKMVWEQEYAGSGSTSTKEEHEYIKKAISDVAGQIK